MDWMPQAVREGILTVLFISGPLVILAASLGLIVGILQAATQVQEQTLGSAVKILGIFLALIVFGFYIFQYLSGYAEQNITRAFKIVPTLGSHPMPRKNPFDVPFKMKEEEDFEDNDPIPFRPPVEPLEAAEPGRSPMSQGMDISGPDTVDINVGRNNDPVLPQVNSLIRPETEDLDLQNLTINTEEINQSPRQQSAAPVAAAQTAPAQTVTAPPVRQNTSPAPVQTVAAPVQPSAPAVTTAKPSEQTSSVEPRKRPNIGIKRPSSGISRLKKSIKEFEEATSAE